MKGNECDPVVELLDVIGDAQALRHDVEAARRRFVVGMCRLLEADGASWSEPRGIELRVGDERASAVLGITIDGHRLSFRRAQPFSSDSRALARLLMNHGWLLEPLLGSALPRHLPRRLRQTLELLLSGHTEKQLALALHLSTHTVHDYVKELYRRLGVSSRGELFAQTFRPPALPHLSVEEGAS